MTPIKLTPTHTTCCPRCRTSTEVLRTIWLLLGNHTLEETDWLRIAEASNGSTAYEPPAKVAYRVAGVALGKETIE